MDNASANATMLEIGAHLQRAPGRIAARAAARLLVRPLPRALRRLRVVRGQFLGRSPRPLRLPRQRGIDRWHGRGRTSRTRAAWRRRGSSRRGRSVTWRGRNSATAAWRATATSRSRASASPPRSPASRRSRKAASAGGGTRRTTRWTRLTAPNFVRDTQVYLLACWRLCTLPVLPFDYTETANELRDRLHMLQESRRWPLRSHAADREADALHADAERLNAAVAATADDADRAERLNAAIMAVGARPDPRQLHRSPGRSRWISRSNIPILPGLAPVADLADDGPGEQRRALPPHPARAGAQPRLARARDRPTGDRPRALSLVA